MAKEVSLQTSSLPFYQSQKGMRQIEIGLFIVGMLALISAGVICGLRTPSFTKTSFIATTASLGTIGLVMIFASIYLYRNGKMSEENPIAKQEPEFRIDAQFYQSYPTFGDFFNNFGLTPFRNNQISGNDPDVRTHYSAWLFSEIDEYGFDPVLGRYCGGSNDRNYLIDMLKNDPERLKKCFIRHLKQLDLARARDWEPNIPKDICQEGEPLAEMVKCINDNDKDAWYQRRMTISSLK